MRHVQSPRTWAAALGASALALLASACGGGGGGGDGSTPVVPAPLPGPLAFDVGPYDPLPGVVMTLVDTSGGTGPGGNFRPGDFLRIRFKLETKAGDPLDLTLMDSGAIYVSGPTTNYNRVIPSQSDLRAASVYLGDAEWEYTFTVPLPAVYAPPINDTASFGAIDGELTGQPLLDGTYTIGIETSAVYVVDSQDKRDAGSLVADVLVGSATTVDRREVVTEAHCDQCHVDLRAHGGRRKGVGLCVLCHTSGAEDKNNPAIEGGSEGVTIDFRVMIHKIHNGEHLPSVLGVGTKADGTRDYAVTPKPYRLVGFDVLDASDVGFPVFPSLQIAMPQDAGYSSLTAPQKAQEDQIRKGVVACAKCHGDPDGAGPITAPAQGALAETQPSRRACGSCHDDVDWARPYAANGDVMIANPDPGACVTCHPAATTGVGLFPVRQSHVHPLVDPVFNPGLSFAVTAVTEAGANNGNGKIDPGEKVQVTLHCTDDSNNPVMPSSVSSINAIVSGPTRNYNLVLNTSIPTTLPAIQGAGPDFTFKLPQAVALELVGTNTSDPDQAFPTVRKPHLNLAAAPTKVYTRNGSPASGGNSISTIDLVPLQNYVDVAVVTNFNGQVAAPAVEEYVVIDDPFPNREYVQVAWVQGNRLWLNSPLRNAHAMGCSVVEVTLTTRTVTTQYTLDATNGIVTEVGTSFGTGTDVIVSYWSDFVMPSVYPPPLNDSPDLGESWGEWKGKPIVDGTYTLDVYGVIKRNLVLYGQTNSYSAASKAGNANFLVGATATTLEPYAIISEAANCYACHDDLWFHGGGRRSFGTCIMCHGDAGAEDRPRYVSPSNPDTPGVSIAFREMLHKIHRGKDLPDADTYTVSGFSGGSQFDDVEFPAMPGGVLQCVKCHGNDAWHQPTNRDHPTAQVVPVRSWRIVCGACHDSSAALAHIDVQTSAGGFESCEVCHGPLREEDVVKVHFPR